MGAEEKGKQGKEEEEIPWWRQETAEFMSFIGSMLLMLIVSFYHIFLVWWYDSLIDAMERYERYLIPEYEIPPPPESIRPPPQSPRLQRKQVDANQTEGLALRMQEQVKSSLKLRATTRDERRARPYDPLQSKAEKLLEESGINVGASTSGQSNQYASYQSSSEQELNSTQSPNFSGGVFIEGSSSRHQKSDADLPVVSSTQPVHKAPTKIRYRITDDSSSSEANTDNEHSTDDALTTNKKTRQVEKPPELSSPPGTSTGSSKSNLSVGTSRERSSPSHHRESDLLVTSTTQPARKTPPRIRYRITDDSSSSETNTDNEHSTDDAFDTTNKNNRREGEKQPELSSPPGTSRDSSKSHLAGGVFWQGSSLSHHQSEVSVTSTVQPVRKIPPRLKLQITDDSSTSSSGTVTDSEQSSDGTEKEANQEDEKLSILTLPSGANVDSSTSHFSGGAVWEAPTTPVTPPLFSPEDFAKLTELSFFGSEKLVQSTSEFALDSNWESGIVVQTPLVSNPPLLSVEDSAGVTAIQHSLRTDESKKLSEMASLSSPRINVGASKSRFTGGSTLETARSSVPSSPPSHRDSQLSSEIFLDASSNPPLFQDTKEVSERLPKTPPVDEKAVDNLLSHSTAAGESSSSSCQKSPEMKKYDTKSANKTRSPPQIPFRRRRHRASSTDSIPSLRDWNDFVRDNMTYPERVAIQESSSRVSERRSRTRLFANLSDDDDPITIKRNRYDDERFRPFSVGSLRQERQCAPSHEGRPRPRSMDDLYEERLYTRGEERFRPYSMEELPRGRRQTPSQEPKFTTVIRHRTRSADMEVLSTRSMQIYRDLESMRLEGARNRPNPEDNPEHDVTNRSGTE